MKLYKPLRIARSASGHLYGIAMRFQFGCAPVLDQCAKSSPVPTIVQHAAVCAFVVQVRNSEESAKVAVIGSARSGKSTLVNAVMLSTEIPKVY